MVEPESDEVVHLSSETTALVIHMLGSYIYSPGVDEIKDLSSTHGEQMEVLNLLIGKLHQSIKDRISDENWEELEAAHEDAMECHMDEVAKRITERISDEGKI